MISIPTGVRVWLATGHTDMRKGFASLALQVQEVLRRDPLSGHLFCFRGRRGNLLKVIWHDGQGACLFAYAWGARDCEAIRSMFTDERPVRSLEKTSKASGRHIDSTAKHKKTATSKAKA